MKKWFLVLAFGSIAGVVVALLSAFGGKPQPAGACPSINLFPQCETFRMRIVTMRIPARGDTMNVHRYWGENGDYDWVKVLWHPDGTVDLEWGFEVKANLQFQGTVDWKGNPEEPLATQWYSCPP